MKISLPVGTRFYVRIDGEWKHLVVVNTDNDDCVGCILADATSGGTTFTNEDMIYACNKLACVNTRRHDNTRVCFKEMEE